MKAASEPHVFMIVLLPYPGHVSAWGTHPPSILQRYSVTSDPATSESESIEP